MIERRACRIRLALKTISMAVFVVLGFMVHVAGALTQNWWAVILPLPVLALVCAIYPYEKYAADVDRLFADD